MAASLHTAVTYSGWCPECKDASDETENEAEANRWIQAHNQENHKEFGQEGLFREAVGH